MESRLFAKCTDVECVFCRKTLTYYAEDLFHDKTPHVDISNHLYQDER